MGSTLGGKSRVTGLPASVLLGLVAVAVFLPLSRFDFDSHHDGVMLAAAVAVRDGLSVHADVFAQYGPLTPWVQGLFLKTGIAPAFGLRFLNVLLIGITVFLIADMGRMRMAHPPISRTAGRWAAVVYIASADVLFGVPMLPWSSVLASAMLAAATWLILRALPTQGNPIRARSGMLIAGLGGLLVGALPFARINVGLIAMAVAGATAVGLVVLWRRGAPGALRIGVAIVTGVAVGFLTVVVLLLLSGSLHDYYLQAIRWPLVQGSEAAQQVGPVAKIATMLVTYALPLSFVTGVILLSVAASRRQLQNGRWVGWLRAAALVLAMGIPILLVRSSVAPIVEGQWVLGLRDFGLGALNFLLCLVVLALALQAVLITRGLFRLRMAGETALRWMLIIGFAAANAGQVFPTIETRHIWWGLPLGLLLVFAVIEQWVPLNSIHSNPIAILTVILLVASAASGVHYASRERVPVRGSALLSGMLVDPVTAESLVADAGLVERALGGGDALFFVNDGDISVLLNDYRSFDSYFVRWGYPPNPIDQRLAVNRTVIVQLPPGGGTEILEGLLPWYDVTDRTARLAALTSKAGVP